MNSDDLIWELHDARHRLRQRTLKQEIARQAYLETKLETSKARDLVEEILMEIETGKSGRPLIDAANEATTEAAGFDLVTSRPDSNPETNGVEIRTRKPRTKAAAEGGGK